MLLMVNFLSLTLFAQTNKCLGAATTAVRDQILRHNPQTGVFSGSYINEKVRFIVQDAVLDQPTDTGFLRAFTHMSLTCDPRAPQTVPKEVRDALPPDPELVELEIELQEHRIELKRKYGHGFIKGLIGTEGGEEFKLLKRQIATLAKTREQELKKEYRRDYFYRIHNEELERQLKKVKVLADAYVEPVIKHQLPERTQLQEIMCNLSKDLNPHDIVMRRIRPIDAMVALSRRQEVPCREPRLSILCSGSPQEGSPMLKEELLIPDDFPLVCEKTQCIFCIGDDRKSYDRRTRTFSKPDKMMDHVESHLDKLPAGIVASSFMLCLRIANAQHHRWPPASNRSTVNLLLFMESEEDLAGIRLKEKRVIRKEENLKKRNLGA